MLDDISRIIASPIPRRQALRLLSGVVGGGVLASLGLGRGSRALAQAHCGPGECTCGSLCYAPPCSGAGAQFTCCGTVLCRNSSQQCCGTYCCTKTQTCCGGVCCGASRSCCNGKCCSAGQVCSKNHCCASSALWCGTACCPKGSYCCANKCYPSRPSTSVPCVAA